MNTQYTVVEGQTIILDTGPQRVARLLGKLRTKMCEEAGLTTTTTARGYSQDEINIVGVGAEIAFCSLFNIMPDLTVNVRKGGPDCRLPGDLYVDVKCTRIQNGMLICNPTKKASDDLIFVLMRCDWPAFTFAGWKWSDQVLVEKYLRETNNGLRYMLPNDELNQFL